LGQRPTNAAEAKAWDRGLTVIETYRRDNGVTDRASAFGLAAKGGAAEARQRKAMERTERGAAPATRGGGAPAGTKLCGVECRVR